ncbi:MAG: acylneuraminate cytidylyltransferase [Bacteroidia bacterium]|nr:acylneuraminate cytidylyltransferase [Bacteroidia bacterium]
MKLVATLACRLNSRRLFGKPLQLLENLSVIEYILQNLKKQKNIHEIVFAISEETGNQIFEEIAKKHRLPYLYGSDKDVLKRLIDACNLVKGTDVFRITTECPFTYWEGLDEAVVSHIELNADYTTVGGLPDGCTFEIIKLDALIRSHNDGTDKHRSELVSLYINENFDKFNINVIQIDPQLQRPHYRLTIDYPEDLILCRKIIRNFGGDHTFIPYKELISFLDKNKELHKLVENITDENYIKPFY